jgi:hypothetical protein
VCHAQLLLDSEQPSSVAIVAATQIAAMERCCFVPLAQYSSFKQQLQDERDDAAARAAPHIAAATAAAAAAATDAEREDIKAALAQQLQAAGDAAQVVSKAVVQPLYAEWLPVIAAADFASGSGVLPSGADYEIRVHELTTHTLSGACSVFTRPLW